MLLFMSFSFNLRFLFVFTLIFFNLLFYTSSFFWVTKRTKQEKSCVNKNLQILLLKQKIRTRHTATNKNFHGTRFAQTPGKFYFLSVNTAKFLMPRLHLTRTFLLLNLVCFAFVSYFTTAYYQKLYNLWLCAIKTCGNIALAYKNLPKYEFERSATFKKQEKPN